MKLRRYGISADFIEQYLRTGAVVAEHEVTQGLPADARLVAASFGVRDAHTLYLTFESEWFEESGAVVQMDSIVVKAREEHEQGVVADQRRLVAARELLDSDVITLSEYWDIINDIRRLRGLDPLNYKKENNR